MGFRNGLDFGRGLGWSCRIGNADEFIFKLLFVLVG